MLKKFTFFSLMFLLLAKPNFSGGFQLNEHGTRAMALGGAFTALANDLSAIYFNPAGLTKLSGFRLMAGTTLISPTASFRGPSPNISESKLNSQLFTPSYLYAAYKLNDAFAVGLGVYNPFGLGTKWDENWVGKFISVDSDLKVFCISPVVAYKFSDMISVSAGLLYNIASVKLDRFVASKDLAPFGTEARIKLEGDESAAIGFSFSTLINFTNNISFGAAYRSEVEFNFEGTATPTAIPAVLPLLPQGDVSATFNSPANLTLGLLYRASSQLSLTADFQYVMWSSYDSLKVDFSDAKYPDISAPKLYEDTYLLRFGAEYQLDDLSALQAGFLYDKNPVKDAYVDPTLPDADRLGITLGGSYKLTNQIELQVSYMFLRFSERTITDSQVSYSASEGFAPFNGTYNTTANLFSIGLNYNF